jgi:CheY-like chemotaxis protein
MSVMHDNSAANASSDSGEKNALEWSSESNRTHQLRFSDSTQAAQAADQQHGGLQHQQIILLVEDDLTLATLEADILTAHGYIIKFAHSGEHAITTLHQVIPDLVVLDLELPGDVHGWDVLQALRAVADIPVLITSSSVNSARKYLRKSGETRETLDHLSKPYPLQALLKHIERMLPISPAP